MNGCFSAHFPSLYELWHAIVEAMAIGKPVLCSNTTSLPEIAGNAALFFDPTKPTEIAEAIRTNYSEPELVKDLVKSVNSSKHFRKFNSHGSRIFATFKQVIKA